MRQSSRPGRLLPLTWITPGRRDLWARRLRARTCARRSRMWITSGASPSMSRWYRKRLRPGLTLAEPLPGGAPAAGAKVQAVTGFVDREGGSFYQEWSALFVMEGSQGERIFFHYPRLQTMTRRGRSDFSTQSERIRADNRESCSRDNFWRCRLQIHWMANEWYVTGAFLPAANALV